MLDALLALERRGVEMLATHQPEERRRLVEARDHRPRRQARSVAQLDAGRAPALDEDAPHRPLHAHLAALVLYSLEVRRIDEACAFLEGISEGWDRAIERLRHIVEAPPRGARKAQKMERILGPAAGKASAE